MPREINPFRVGPRHQENRPEPGSRARSIALYDVSDLTEAQPVPAPSGTKDAIGGFDIQTKDEPENIDGAGPIMRSTKLLPKMRLNGKK